MKKLYILLLILTGHYAFAQKTINRTFKTIKIYSVNLNNDDIPDTIRLSSSVKDKDDFNRITVSLTGFGKKTFIAKELWTTVDDAFLKNNKNDLKSSSIYLKGNSLQNVILLFGIQDGAGYRAEFSIINIENNQIKMIFDDTGEKNIEIPNKLIDLDNDGRFDFLYRITFQFSKQLKEGNLGSYSPYFIYTIANPCVLNKPLMKQYNEKNYVFAGYEYNENIDIYYPDNKNQKPSIWKK